MTDERRAHTRVIVHNTEPPTRKGRLHTVNFKDRRGHEETYLADKGISVGYAYEHEGYYLLAYYEEDRLCPACEIPLEQESVVMGDDILGFFQICPTCEFVPDDKDDPSIGEWMGFKTYACE